MLDMRDEGAALCSEELRGELPPELEFEEFNQICQQLTTAITQALVIFHRQETPLNLGQILRDYFAQYPQARHFDVARILVDQAIRLGLAAADFSGLAPEWSEINDYGAEVQAHVIDRY